MFQYFNNTNNRKERNSNSDLISIRDEYTNMKTTMSSNMFNNVSINELFKSSQKKIQSYEKLNNSEKKFNETNTNNQSKIKKIIEEKIIKNLNKKRQEEKNKSNNRKMQTKMELMWQRETFFKTYLDKIPNISFIQKNDKKKKSETIKESKIIYYNSSMENFYKSKNMNKYPSKMRKKCLSTLTSTNKIHFINSLLRLYKNKDKDKFNLKIKIKKSIEKADKTEEENNNILKGFNFSSGSKSALKILFEKAPLKLKTSIPIKETEKILNPITNSYGNLLDHLSDKVAFMKDSMDMIYPKISQAKYMIKGPKKDYESMSQNQSLINDYNFERIRDLNIIYKIKKRKINQTLYSKYPLHSRNKYFREKLLPIKKYSLNREMTNL